MDWSKGYSAAFYAMEVDPATFRDRARIDITGGNIKRTPTGLRNSATIDTPAPVRGIEMYVRVYMDTEQDGEYGHEALFTGLATSPKRKTYDLVQDSSLDCYSVLKAADDVILPRGWYAYAGTNSAQVLEELLSVTPAPLIVADGAPALSTTLIAEDNESRLSMAEKIVDAINWHMYIDGYGTVHVEPYSADAVVTFDPAEHASIEAPLSVKEDWYGCPNVYRAIAGDLVATVRDDNPESPLSTVKRGREVWKIDTNVNLSANESIAEYASRALRESQRVNKTISYNRRFEPSVQVGNVVRLHYPNQDVDGDFVVGSQTITIGGCARTSETVVANVAYKEDAADYKQPTIFHLIDNLENYIVTAEGDRIVFIE